MLHDDNSQPTFKSTLLFWAEFLGFAIMVAAGLKFLVAGFSVQNHYEVHVDDRRSYETTTTTENNCSVLNLFCRPGSANSEDRRQVEEVKQ